MRRNHDGARRRDPLTYRRDAAILEAALAGRTQRLPEVALHLLSRPELSRLRREGEGACQLPRAGRAGVLGAGDLHQPVSGGRYGGARPSRAGSRRHLPAPQRDRPGPRRGAARRQPLLPDQGTPRGRPRLRPPGLAICAPGGPIRRTLDLRIRGARRIRGQRLLGRAYRESLDASIKLLCERSCPGDRARFAANARVAVDRLPRDANLGSRVRPALSSSTRLCRPGRCMVSVRRAAGAGGHPRQAEGAVAAAVSGLHRGARLPQIRDGALHPHQQQHRRTEQILRDWVARVGASLRRRRVRRRGRRRSGRAVRRARVERYPFPGAGRNPKHSLRWPRSMDATSTSSRTSTISSGPTRLRELVAAEPADRRAAVAVHRAPAHSTPTSMRRWTTAATTGIATSISGCSTAGSRGVLEMPVVHCTYLIRANVLDAIELRGWHGASRIRRLLRRRPQGRRAAISG